MEAKIEYKLLIFKDKEVHSHHCNLERKRYFAKNDHVCRKSKILFVLLNGEPIFGQNKT